MNANDCLKHLVMPDSMVAEKTDVLEEYLSFKVAVGRSVGIPKHWAIKLAVDELFQALPDGDNETKSRLMAVLDDVQSYQLKIRDRNDEDSKKKVAVLQSLEPGTPIIIQKGNREEVVFFLELKRTRFICESPDGRKLDVPAGLFGRVHEGKAPARKAGEEVLNGELVRALAGRNYAVARQTILAGGLKYIPALLSELGFALQRIKNAPVGFSQGVFRNCLGPVKKVSPVDEALVKRIPQLVKEFSEGCDAPGVQKMIDAYPDDQVRLICQEGLASRKVSARLPCSIGPRSTKRRYSSDSDLEQK